MPNASDDIVVVAYPQQVTSGFFTINAPLGASGPAGGTNMAPIIAQNRAASERSVEVDPDASDADIVVIASRIKNSIFNMMTVATAGITINSPCMPPLSGMQLRAMIGSLKFKVTTKDYGEGRAGENLTDSSTTGIPVNVNATALKGYDKLGGGISYLILHEVAHSLPAMRNFAKAQFDQWYAREGSGLTGQALADAYAGSAEFKLNEARANTIAKAMIDQLPNSGTFNFTPKHEYTTC